MNKDNSSQLKGFKLTLCKGQRRIRKNKLSS